MASGLPASAGHVFAGWMGLGAAGSRGSMPYPLRAERDCSHASCSFKITGGGEKTSLVSIAHRDHPWDYSRGNVRAGLIKHQSC